MLGGDGGGKAGEGGWENGVGPLRGKPLFCLPDGGLFSACPAGATAQPLAAMPPYGWGVPPAGKTAFSFVGERGVFYLTVGFLPTRLGAKTTFSFDSKEKAVLDSEKEKVDRRKFWGGAVQQDGGPILLGCSLGKILWAILLSSAACV